MKYTILLLLGFIVLNSCNQHKTTFGYYVILNQDSIDNAINDSLICKGLPPRPPRIKPAPPVRWYSNVVMIFDTANKVYLYQTECMVKEIKTGTSKEEILRYDYPEEIGKYPNFIGLNPERMITLRAEYLLDFLKDNDNYFKLDTNYCESNRFFYIVSDFDTIKNPGFYTLREHINAKKHTRKGANIYHIIRKTTEEERNVLSCKRVGKYYNPRAFQWSSNFLDGETKPFMHRYDSLENTYLIKIKAKEIFKPEAMNIKPIK